MDISDLNEADVLAALYNASRAQGLGFIHFKREEMQRMEAEALLREYRDFDYLKGRVMKIHFFDPDRRLSERNRPGFLGGEWLYDRDNGAGAFARVISEVRSRPKRGDHRYWWFAGQQRLRQEAATAAE